MISIPEPFTHGATPAQIAAGLRARGRFISDAIAAGEHDPIAWSPITTDGRGHSGTFYVSSDAVKLGGVRVNVDAITAQRSANALGCLLPTSRVSDLAWEQAAARIPVTAEHASGQILGASATMASTANMITHSAHVDTLVPPGTVGLVRDVGKDWIIHPRMAAKPATQAINYGWHDPKAASVTWSHLRAWQPVGTRHDTSHVDYSQVLTLVRGDMLVNGEVRRTEDVLRDPELAWLLSDDGALRVTRYAVPGEEVPREATPTDELTLAALLRDAHAHVFGELASVDALSVAWAHVALENGRGKAIWSHNMGNITAGSTWAGNYYVLATKPPDPPTLKFRAHASALDGAVDYWAFLSGRYALALARFDAGDVPGAVRELKAKGYMTANAGPYEHAMAALQAEFRSSVLPQL